MRPALIALLTALAAPAIAQEDPEATWSRSCARCHRAIEPVMAPYADLDAGSASQRLDTFLSTHRAPDPDMRAALVAWLLAQIAE